MAESFKPPALPPPFTNTPPANEPLLLAQGAEALLYKSEFLSPSTPAALKIRPSKEYRHPILDRRLTRQRILQEARCLVKLAREGVSVPGVLAADWEGTAAGEEGDRSGGGAWLLMEWIEGTVVRQVVERWERWMKSVEREQQGAGGGGDIKSAEEKMGLFLNRIGRAVGSLHNAGVIHGDLTTSNMMLRPVSAQDAEAADPADGAQTSLEGEIVLIDFGLASQSTQDEDRAVDLYVLERAFGSSHPRTEQFFEKVLAGYADSYKGAKPALKRLEDVRMRGRKRSMVG